jgi:Do/DeqQ family serine protease
MKGKFEIRRSMAVLVLVLASIGGGLTATMMTAGHGHVPIFVTANAATVEPTGNLTSFAPVVKHASPAVVNISTTTIIKANQNQGRRRRGQQDQDQDENQFLNDPMFRQFFGNMNPFNQVPRSRRESALGSGVIVSPDGYILTNNHVVEGATSVKVTLADRRELAAKVVGTDPQSDIAVIKIDARNLPVLPLSDSSKAQVGDVCLAIGDPFGIGQTVTMGIVSATGRNLGGAIEQYEDFIQTDAAINPGNSGGALINTRGELIGINTAILAGNSGMGQGGNVGVGFAIPVNMARAEMDQLIKTGKVTRGYLGAYLQDVDANMAKALNLPNTDGAMLTQVDAGTPAAKAGLKAEDVVVSMNGEPVVDMATFRLRVAAMAPGSVVKLHLYRGGQPMDVNVTLGERPANLETRNTRNSNGNDQGQESGLQGVSVDNLTADIAQQLELPRNTAGVVVTDVDAASPAAEAGLERGDVIMQVNRTPVHNTSDFDRLVNQSKGQIVLMINRGGVTRFVALSSK